MRPSILPSSKKIGWPASAVVKGFGERAGDVREPIAREAIARQAMVLRSGRIFLLRQHQEVARVQPNGFLDEGQFADVARGDFLAVAHQRQSARLRT